MLSAAMVNIGRDGKGAINVPLKLDNTAPKSALRHMKVPGPCGKGPGLAVMSNKMDAAAVGGLNVGGRPADIARFVTAFIIDSIETMPFGWPLAYMSQEGFKGSFPLRTYADASPAIVGIVRMRLRTASSAHTDPCRMLRGASDGLRFPSGCMSGDMFFKETAAGAGIAGAQPGQTSDYYLPAVAGTCEAAFVSGTLIDFPDDGQAVESHPRLNIESLHEPILVRTDVIPGPVNA